MASSKKITKICFVAPKAYPVFNRNVKKVFGGAELNLYWIATELAKDNRFEVSFITADYGQRCVEMIEGVRVIKSLDFNESKLSGAIKIWKAMQKTDAHVYFQCAASLGTFLVAFFSKIHNKMFVYHIAHIRECDGTYLKQHFFVGKAFAWSLRTAANIIVRNKTDVSEIEDTFGVQSHIIKAGQHLPVLYDTKKDIILWVARSARIKRPELFIELAEKKPHEQFVMVCQHATGEQGYDELVARAGRVPNLQFITRAEFEEMNEYFANAKIFVCTSKGEGFPTTYVEACKYRTPILSLSVNPDDFLNKYKCGLCADDRWDRFVSQLNVLLTEQARKQYAENARKYVEKNHDIKVVIEDYKNVLRSLI